MQVARRMAPSPCYAVHAMAQSKMEEDFAMSLVAVTGEPLPVTASRDGDTE